MANLTVAKAKKQIISQIKRKGGLFENCGQKELNAIGIGKDWHELNEWIESLDYVSVKLYL